MGPAAAGWTGWFIQEFVFLPYTPELAQTWARVMTHTRRLGRRLEAGDAWIASSAVLYAVPLLTNDKDFVDLEFEGLSVICHAE
jgi:predicted nucleic acid-binding protein